ncbi:putative Ig domain-containing protein [Spirosoma utsteinense]|uniref:Dystroglycan-type cadherin-like domain-containing protein n=1 Tax=Spirosoma utsteinense TaxID=2585773 RepID=A0ABR6W6H8_9BACT|nr:putative Ig domain-containing protein [Spirosoma utsteinense]MBC3792159.1 hypothetical protein [Spirosoma utsteinense]
MTLSLPSFTRFLVRTLPLLVLLSGSSLLTQAQSIRYVKSAATGNGSSWANASGDLQAMINASSNGQQVWVATGTYKPGGNANTDRTVSFAMKNGVNMYGGFVGNETALGARPAINLTTPSATILSGDIGAAGDAEDNSFHVILNRLGVTNITVLDGFVITGGNANEPGPPQEPRNIGGGICNVDQSSFANPSSGPPSSPQISNCLFVANSATFGGAIYNGGSSASGVSSPTLTNCVFRNNTAISPVTTDPSKGGAIYNRGGSSTAIQPTLTNCLFQSNSADAGGAVYNDGFRGRTSSPELTNCSFEDNRAVSGGAICNNGRSDGGNSSPKLTNCSFKTNRAADQGGAIFNDGDFNGNSSPLIRNCSFQTNSAVDGGAIYNLTGGIRGDNRSSPKLTNCLFQSNTASSGGAVYNFTRYEGEIELVLTNCTFQANNAGAGGVLFGFGYGNGYLSNTTLINCVLFGNGGASTFTNNSTTISATYSLFDASVNGYSDSPSNRKVTVSPFASTSDPALFACSPAVNAGLNSATGLVGITTDLANNPRIFGERVDMGAYEYQAAGGLAITVPSVSTATSGVAFSQPFVASGGAGPYSYSLASGSLPAGLSLAANGTLSGTPAGVGSFSITVKATNATSCSGVSAPYVLRVASATPIRYVRAGAKGSGNSWADASGNLQSQINFTGAEQVWVATGTYKPTTTNDRSISFSMKNGVPIYGGFAGNETVLSQRVLSTPLATILSGDIGAAGNTADNSYHVINNPTGLTNTAVLDGFLITGGNANGNSPDDSGGGMINNGSSANNNCSPLIRNCLFLGNTAANGGGALYNAGYTNGNSNPSLINCAFQSNAANRGGAIYNDGSIGGNSNPSLTNCSFQANSAASGGAMGNVAFQGNSRPVLTNCVVWGNGGASTFNNQQGAFITTSYSLFETSATGYNAGTGNLTTTTSPFASTTTTLLSCSSSAIDAGDPATPAATVGSIDLAGNARFFNGGRIDMGAYEVQEATTIAITTPNVSTATLGADFNQSFTATGGTGPYSYSLASGSLPTGLGLATTGVLSGTPTQIGSFTITVLGRSARGCSGVSAAYVLTVRAPISPIRYVRAGAAGSGSSWADASGNLQSQIDFAGAQQVWVAQGTYKPTTTTGPDSRTISFTMKNGVRIIGGFAATDTPTLAERNPGRFVTTLSGDIGTAGNTGDNSYHVIRNLFIDNTAVLDGFFITGGRANGTSDQPTDGKGFGGGMYNYGGSPVLIDCNFQSNSASFEGGGLFNFGNSEPTVVNCSFQSNSASFGGGMSNNSSSPTVINGTFQSNTASTIGGGVYNYYGSPKLISCLFQANSALEGGGMYSSNAETTPTVINCSFQGNSAQRGGGVANAYTNVTLTNCTFQGNTATIFGGGVYNLSGSASLTNCVLFGNGEANTLYSISGSVGATYSLFESSVTGYAGDNNLTTTVSPFVSPTDASLNGCSPAINAGDNAAYNAAYPPTISSTTDVAGNPRLFPSGGRIDMGAYEYQAAPNPAPTVAIPSVSTVTVGVAFSQTFTASGSNGPYSYSLVGGSLPPGLSLSTTGVLSGTPTQTGSFTLTVLGQGANGCSREGAPYVLTVQPATPIRYVRVGASGSGNSWADASGDLQSQIRLSGAEQVWVAQGTYTPGPAGNTDRNARFAMKNGVRILGGFAASGNPTLTERNLTGFPTVLSGDIGEAGNPADNAYSVINNPPGLTATAVLDGFVIRDGNANGSDYSRGGGMINDDNSSPTLINCSFVSNSATEGGGIYNNFYSTPTLINCSFIGNSASQVGGAVYNYNSNPSFTNCSFVSNSASQRGSVLFSSYNINLTLTNCVLFNNGGPSTFYTNTGSVTVRYSLMETGVTGYTDGGNNLTTTVSPFVSSSDTRLNGCAPAINAGDNAAYSSANGPSTDPASNARIFPSGGRNDMGAYEYQAPPTVIIVSAPGVSTAAVGVAFSQTFTASGGSSPYTYTVDSGSLPTGLNLASNGTLSGAPTQAGSFTITVKTTDASGCSGVSAPYVLTVESATPIRYVRTGATGSGNSWADASGDLRGQIDLVGTQQVWVAQGTYKPTGTPAAPGTDRNSNFSMKNGVSILGGFPASGNPTLTERNPAGFPTILSGDIGTVGSNTDNSLHVIYNSNVDNTAVLDGFVIRDGNANASGGFESYGGGIFNTGSSPTLTNCSFLSNAATVSGGGVYSYQGSTTLTNCVFQGNSASFGGGILSQYGSLAVTNCSFQGNTASQGGAIFAFSGISTLTNCVLFDNGGTNTFYGYDGGSVTVRYSLLETGVTGYTDGGNNLTTTVSPFVSSSDTRLNGCAPAINAGDNAAYSSANGPATDPASNARIFPSGGRIDMGAYEYQAPPTVFTLPVPGVSTATLGVPFSQTFTASGGTSPYSYSLAIGSLPPGLSLANTGVLSGTPTQTGSFTITVKAADANGCSGVSAPYGLTVTEAVSPNPTLAGFAASPGAVCVGSPVAFTATVGNLTGEYSYTLTNGGSAPLTGSASGSPFSQSITASGTGTQSFTLTVSANGQSASSVTALTVNPRPVASLVSSGTLSCGVTSVTLTASPSGQTYTFSSGATQIGNGPTATVSNAGVYSVTVITANGCSATASTSVISTTAAVTITMPGVSTATVDVAFSQAFTASGGTGPYSYSLASGSLPPGLSLASTGVLSGTPTQSGSFTITVRGQDATGCSGVSAPYGLTVTEAASPNPTLAGFAASPGAVCAGSPVSFTAMVGNVTGEYSYTLTNGSSTPLSGSASGNTFSQSLTATGSGAQRFTLTVSDDGQSASSETTLTVNPLPMASLTNNGPLSCAQTSVTLTADGGSSYTFASGSGVLGTPGPANTVVVSTPGTYSVTVASASGCVSTTSTSVTADQQVPLVSISPSSATLSCTSPTVSLTAMGTGTVRWSTGETTPIISVTTAGTYSVTLTSASSCSASASAVIGGDQSAPTASISPSSATLTCASPTVSLTAVGAGNVLWSTGSTDRVITVSASGTYSVTLTSANGCSASASAVISGDQSALTVSLVSSGSLTCAVVSVTLTASPNGQTYTFSGPGVISSTGNTAVVNVAGTYSVTVTNGITGCASTTSITISRDASTPIATISASPSTTLSCAQTSLTLTAGGGNSYTFNGPGVVSQSGNQAVVNASGTYSVTVTNESTGCFSTTSITISQDNTVPSASLASSGTLSCAVTSVTLTANPNGQSYRFSAGASQIGSSNQATVSTPGLYSVTVINGGNGCTGVASVSVGQDNTAPQVTITANPSLTVTQGQSATLTAQGGNTYTWSTGANSDGIVVSTAGTYSLTGTATNGCTGTASATLTVNPVVSGPFAITAVTTVSCDPILPNRFSVSFNPRYQGLDGTAVSFSVANELFPTVQPGPYTLQLYADNPTITLNAVQNGVSSRFAYNWLAACNSATTPNTPPRVQMGIPGQTATQGSYVSYVIPDGTFTDTETPGSLKLSATGLPPGLSFSGATLSGTPSSTVGSPVSLTITATDPGGLTASTTLQLTVQPATGTPAPTAPFAITGVTTISCTPVADRISISFAPRYAGMSGQPIAFEVVNELAPTTDPAPYSLTLYRDNPVITLRATQTNGPGPVTFRYNWLTACASVGQDNTPPLLNEPVTPQSATVGVGYSLNVVNTFIDQETPNQITLTSSVLPAGLSLSGKMISGSPSMSGVSSVTLTATDGGGLSTSTIFSITVVPGTTQPPTPPTTGPFSITGVTTVSCEVVSASQRRVTFSPRYAGLDGNPVSFRVVNETVATTNSGPYSLTLYTDNPVIALSAVQNGASTQFSYNWLSACSTNARQGAFLEVPLSVVVLGNPVAGETVRFEVRGAEGQPLQLTLINLQGQVVSKRVVEQAGSVEIQSLPLSSQPAGLLLLRVSTPRQSQTVNVLNR